MLLNYVVKKEGIIPALEPSHALAYVKKIASKLPQDHIMVMNMAEVIKIYLQ